MAVIRVEKTKDYTVMSNCHLKDKRLSLKSKGLLSIMLSLSDEWQYSIAGLVAICKENETAIKTTLTELRATGYLVMNRKLPNETASGRFEYEYIIYEQPIEKQGVENLPIENQQIEKQGVENQGQLNTNKSNINKSSTNKANTKRESGNRFTPPTVEDVKAYCEERHNAVDAERFVDYYTSNGWYVGKKKMKDWKAAVRNWERTEKQNTAEPTEYDYGSPEDFYK